LSSRLASKLLGFWLSGFGLGLGSRLASKLLISRLIAMHLPHWIAPLASLGFGLPWASMFWLGFGLAMAVYVLAWLWASLGLLGLGLALGSALASSSRLGFGSTFWPAACDASSPGCCLGLGCERAQTL
jgi:hypothetical protein